MRRWTIPLAATLLVGCGASEDTPPGASDALDSERRETLIRALASQPAGGTSESLVVRLAFGEDADLDLYVTETSQETVYFGNSPAAGGELLGDLRCDSPAPRIETVFFARRAAGRVRVGVDAPEACREGVRETPFVVELWAGERRIERRGVASVGRFDVIVLEADVDGASAARP